MDSVLASSMMFGEFVSPQVSHANLLAPPDAWENAMSDCRCAQCWGLAEYMDQVTGRDYGLMRAPGCQHSATLRVLTFGDLPENAVGVPVEVACDRSLTCSCGACSLERRRLVLRGSREVVQPWIPKRKAA